MLPCNSGMVDVNLCRTVLPGQKTGEKGLPMLRGFLSGITVCAAILITVAVPAVSQAQAKPASPSAATPKFLRQQQLKGEMQCVQPAAHLNPKTLSDAQLALYGLPGRRVLESAPAFWSVLLKNYHHRTCGTAPAIPGPKFRFVHGYGQNWAGNWAYGSRGTFRAATVSFTVPAITGKTNSLVGFWAGVGGQGLQTSPLSLVQDGVGIQVVKNSSGTGTHNYIYAWYEVVNPSCDVNSCDPVTVSLTVKKGDEVSPIVSSNESNDGYDYFTICDDTSGSCSNPKYIYTTNTFSDSATGECIGEEPNADAGDDANFGTVELLGCDLNDAGSPEPIGAIAHNYSYLNTGNNGSSLGGTLVSVGRITDDQNYALKYCTKKGSGDNCG
jgi:hypothetical protein